MIQIHRSQIESLPFEYGGAVDAYIKLLKAHTLREGEAAPSAPHALVERGVRRVQHPMEAEVPDDFVPNFQIVELTLDEQKARKLSDLHLQAQAAVDTIEPPPLKRRLVQMDHAAAMAVPEKKRNSDHKRIIKDAEDRGAKLYAVTYHLAKQEAAIHDLTDDTIATWSAEPFPT